MRIRDKEELVPFDAEDINGVFSEEPSPHDTDESVEPHKSLKYKKSLSRKAEINDIDLMLSSESNFNYKRRKELEAHRKNLVKAQQEEEREKLRLAKEARKEETRRIKWEKKAKDIETATKIAEERQKEALARDRKRRANRRKVDRVFDFIGKIIFGIILIVGVLCISNQTVRDRVAITFNNLFELVQEWTDGKDTPSNKTVDELLKPLGEDLNKADTSQDKETKQKEPKS